MYSPKDAWIKRDENKRTKGNLVEKDMVLNDVRSLANSKRYCSFVKEGVKWVLCM